MNKKTGITLIALVITIIVMLILTSIGLSLALGKGGLVEKAISGKQESQKSQVMFELEHQVADIIAKGESEGLTHDEINQKIKEYFNDIDTFRKLTLLQQEYNLPTLDAVKEKILSSVGWVMEQDETKFPPIEDSKRAPMTLIIKPNYNKKAALCFSKEVDGCKIDWGDGIITPARKANEHTYEEDKQYTIKIFGNFKGAYFMRSEAYEVGGEDHGIDQYTISPSGELGWPEWTFVNKIESWGENNFGRIVQPFSYEQGTDGIEYNMPLPRTFESTTQINIPTGFLEVKKGFLDNAINLVSYTGNSLDYDAEFDENLFANCKKLRYLYQPTGVTKLNLTDKIFANNPELEVIVGAFENCQEMKGPIPANLFANNKKLKVLDKAFSLCEELGGPIPEQLFANNPELEYLNNGFEWCENLEGPVPAKLFANNPNLKSMSRLFIGCGKLKGPLPAELFENNKKIENINSLFAECNSLTGVGPLYWEQLPEVKKKEDAYAGVYGYCKNLSNYNELPENVK